MGLGIHGQSKHHTSRMSDTLYRAMKIFSSLIEKDKNAASCQDDLGSSLQTYDVLDKYDPFTASLRDGASRMILRDYFLYQYVMIQAIPFCNQLSIFQHREQPAKLRLITFQAMRVLIFHNGFPRSCSKSLWSSSRIRCSSRRVWAWNFARLRVELVRTPMKMLRPAYRFRFD